MRSQNDICNIFRVVQNISWYFNKKCEIKRLIYIMPAAQLRQIHLAKQFRRVNVNKSVLEHNHGLVLGNL
jgi:hypothetical protein